MKSRKKPTPAAAPAPDAEVLALATTPGEGDLTPAEVSALEACERRIAAGLQTFLEVGQDLMTIRDGKLYRRDYGTFEEYLRQRWDMDRSYGKRLMAAAQVVESLKMAPMGAILPVNERQVRPLTSLEPEDQRTVWQAAVQTAPEGKPTGAHVERVVKQHRQAEGRAPARKPPPAGGHVLAEDRLHLLCLKAIDALNKQGRAEFHTILIRWLQQVYVDTKPLNQPGKKAIREEILPAIQALTTRKR